MRESSASYLPSLSLRLGFNLVNIFWCVSMFPLDQFFSGMLFHKDHGLKLPDHCFKLRKDRVALVCPSIFATLIFAVAILLCSWTLLLAFWGYKSLPELSHLQFQSRTGCLSWHQLSHLAPSLYQINGTSVDRYPKDIKDFLLCCFSFAIKAYAPHRTYTSSDTQVHPFK